MNRKKEQKLIQRKIKEITFSFFSWHAPCSEGELKGCKPFLKAAIESELFQQNLRALLYNCDTTKMNVILTIMRPQKNELEKFVKLQQT